MKLYQMDSEQWQYNMNGVKDAVIDKLHKDGFIDCDAEKLQAAYIVVFHKKGFFGSAFDKLRGLNDELASFVVIRAE